MTAQTLTLSAHTKASLDRLEQLCGYLDHMLSEAFERTEDASLLCEGEAKDKVQRAGASLIIAMEFRDEITRQVEALHAA